MKIRFNIHRGSRIQQSLALVSALLIAGCHSESSQPAEHMTSYSQGSSATAQLFTIPQDQMSHVQLVTIAPSTLKHVLRLTGNVAYTAFLTTPVITQVGGPVSRILVVPGEHVKAGQPMLEVSSPDYAQLLDAYLKAEDSFRLAQKNYDRAKD